MLWPVLVLGSVVSTSAPNLEWDAPSECPTSRELSREVERLRLDSTASRDLNVTARIERREGGGYVLDLTLRAAENHDAYTLHALDCVDLLGAAAVVIATALDADEDAEHPAIPEAPYPAAPRDLEPIVRPAPEPEPQPTTPKRSEPTSRSRNELPQVAARIGFGVGTGREGPASYGPRAGVGLLWPHVRLGVDAAYLVPTRVEVGDAKAAVVRAALVSTRACWRYVGAHLELPACGIAEGGWFSARGRGWVHNRTVGRPFVAAGLGTGLYVEASSLVSLGVDAAVLASIAGPRLMADGRTVWKPGPVGARFGVSLEFRVGGTSHEHGH